MERPNLYYLCPLNDSAKAVPCSRHLDNSHRPYWEIVAGHNAADDSKLKSLLQWERLIS